MDEMSHWLESLLMHLEHGTNVATELQGDPVKITLPPAESVPSTPKNTTGSVTESPARTPTPPLQPVNDRNNERRLRSSCTIQLTSPVWCQLCWLPENSPEWVYSQSTTGIMSDDWGVLVWYSWLLQYDASFVDFSGIPTPTFDGQRQEQWASIEEFLYNTVNLCKLPILLTSREFSCQIYTSSTIETMNDDWEVLVQYSWLLPYDASFVDFKGSPAPISACRQRL